ncbi:MAG: dienelactone hydrolase family protein [Chitinophagaceae bacterium]|nr:MAG: dienelactone hydrolase family protein [Chitinophagaceae bacterium]
MKRKFTWMLTLGFALAMGSCNNEDKGAGTDTKTDSTKQYSAKEEEVSYTSGGTTMRSFVVYDQNREGTRPAVLVIPEWWGIDTYPKNRARQLAALGYIAIAVDMYGEGKVAQTPDSAKAWATPFYVNPGMARERFDAALAKLKSYPQTDSSRIAAIGYCFGGAQVLNMARLGEDLKAVVSFHGNLVGVQPDKSKLKAEVLVCHGGADPFVPQAEVDQFKKQMDSIGAKYTFKVYDGATHAFTNPEATEKGKKFGMPISYNPAADTASWKDMLEFFDRVLK